jgi:ABC-type transporter Mla subunit MlaD
MDRDNINQALAQLEQSLKELDSARKQVEKITESGTTLLQATSKLTNEVKGLADKVKDETSNAIVVFSEKLSDLEKKLKNISESGKKSIMAEVEKFTETTSELSSSTENAIKEIKSLSAKTIKQQEEEISKTIKVINGYCTNIQILIDEIKSIDLPHKLENLDSGIIKAQKSLSELQENQAVQFEKLEEEVKLASKKQLTNTYITWGLILLVGIILSILIYSA